MLDVARRLSGHDGVRGEAVEVRIADTTVRAFTDESIAAAALASGARVLVTLLHALKQRGGQRGLASLCLGGGEAVALAVEMI